MSTDLVLKGTFTLGGTDVSAEVTAVILKNTVNDVQIPATLAAGKSHAAGASKHEIQIDYLSTDGDTGVLFEKLWTAIGTDAKELAWTCLLRNGAVGVTNPQWAGTLVVSGADVGGDVGALSTGSISCTLTGKPTKVTA